jgi:hypothetical protein
MQVSDAPGVRLSAVRPYADGGVAMNARDSAQHVMILGWLFIIGHAIFLVIGAFVFLLLTGIGLAVADPDARLVLPVVGTAVGSLLVLLSLPGLIAGYGLLTAKPWARMLALVIGILNLVNVPIGTLIGVYACWVLLQQTTREYFERHSAMG